MSTKRITFLLVIFLLLISCSPPKKDATPTNDTQQQVEDAILETSDVETQVAQALTQTALINQPERTNTPLPFSETPVFTEAATSTLTPEFTLTEPSLSTMTPSPSPTIKASATPCYVVLDDWCLAHAGCSTMTISNKTTSNATITLKNTKYAVNVTFQVPPTSLSGTCTMVLRPGSYYYEFSYCGLFNSGNHALNDNWYLNLKCP
jgi:hypothetical protein